MRSRIVLLLMACLALPGCAVNLYGKQSSAGGAATTVTAGSVGASAGAGQARFAASFGSPPPPGAAGGQIGLSRGAAAVLVLGLVIAEAFEFIGAQFQGATPAARPAPQRASIAETCSCYGWKPEPDAPQAAAQVE